MLLGLLLGLLYDSRDFEEGPIAGTPSALGPAARIQNHAGEKLAARVADWLGVQDGFFVHGARIPHLL